MKPKSVIYLSLILTGFLSLYFLPFLQVTSLIGLSPSIAFLAAFQPYFGWKKTLLIHVILLGLFSVVYIDRLQGLFQSMNTYIGFSTANYTIGEDNMLSISLTDSGIVTIIASYLYLFAIRTIVLLQGLNLMKKHLWTRIQV